VKWLVVFNYLSAATILVPLILFVFYKGFADNALRPLGILLFISASVEAFSVIAAFEGLNNLWLMYPFLIVEFLCLFFVFHQLQVRKIPHYVLLIMLLFLGGIEVFEIFYVNGLWKFGAISRTAESALLVGVSLYAFIDILKNEKSIYLQNVPLFWLAVSVLLYSAGNLFVFSSYNILSYADRTNYWMVHAVLNIAFNLLLTKFIQCQAVQYKFR
jgi:hypothetical protein